MFFDVSLSDKHLKGLKKNSDVFYLLISKMAVFSTLSFERLITIGKENGLAKITDLKIHKNLQVDTELDLYKFRISRKYRCYCTRNLHSNNVLNLVFIDVHHDI